MAAKDKYHDIVKQALIQEGWTITEDPYVIKSLSGRPLKIDLGAQRELIGAKKGEEKIVVEIKSFISKSPVTALYNAIGQYQVYQDLLFEKSVDRELFLAIPNDAYEGVFKEMVNDRMIQRLELKLIIFEKGEEKIISWKK